MSLLRSCSFAPHPLPPFLSPLLFSLPSPPPPPHSTATTHLLVGVQAPLLARAQQKVPKLLLQGHDRLVLGVGELELAAVLLGVCRERAVVAVSARLRQSAHFKRHGQVLQQGSAQVVELLQ